MVYDDEDYEKTKNIFRPYLHEHKQQIVFNVYMGLLSEFDKTSAIIKRSILTKVCKQTVQAIIKNDYPARKRTKTNYS